MRIPFLLAFIAALFCFLPGGNAQDSNLERAPAPDDFGRSVGTWGPRIRDGSMIGFRVVGVGDLFAQIGLEPGDIITGVNGEAIVGKSPSFGNTLRVVLEGREPFELEFMRNGKIQMVRYPRVSEKIAWCQPSNYGLHRTAAGVLVGA